MNYSLADQRLGYEKKHITSHSGYSLMRDGIVLVSENIASLDDKQKANIEQMIETKLDPIYGVGATNKLFEKMNSGDRIAKIVYNEDQPIGIINMKNTLQHEEKECDKRCGYVELKTFMIFNDVYKGKDIAYHMFEEVIRMIKKQSSLQRSDGIYVSVSQTHAPETLHFLETIGFRPYKSKQNAYTEGNIEQYLFLPREINY